MHLLAKNKGEEMNPNSYEIKEIVGLSKREYFAAMAMQGLCACNGNWEHKQQAEIAVYKADALIAELNREEETK